MNHKYDGHKQNTTALQLLNDERAHIEEYLQNAAAKKKELDKYKATAYNLKR